MDDKSASNHYNSLVYVKEIKTSDKVLNDKNDIHNIQEDDVMTLISTLMANTKSENIENTSRRSILGASRNDFFAGSILLYIKTL